MKIPSVLSSFHEASPPSFEKFKPRTNLLLKKKDVYLLDYDVNLNAVAKALGKRGISILICSAFFLKICETS